MAHPKHSPRHETEHKHEPGGKQKRYPRANVPDRRSPSKQEGKDSYPDMTQIWTSLVVHLSYMH